MRNSYIPTAINWPTPKRDGPYPGPAEIDYENLEDGNKGPHPGPSPGNLESLTKKD
ncbi:MAG: hypothetical protein AABY03_02505 [Nanoarchaeota archaeon]